MHARNPVAVSAAVGLLLAALVLSAPPAVAQEVPSGMSAVDGKRVTITLEDVDIRDALKALFRDVGASFALDPSVKGTVTVSLTDIPFGTALDAMVKNAGSTVPLECRVEGSVWMVGPKAEEPQQEPAREPTRQPAQNRAAGERPPPGYRLVKIHLSYADAHDIAAALGGGYIPNRFGQIATGMSGGFGGYGGALGTSPFAGYSPYSPGGLGGGWGTGFGNGGYGGYGAYGGAGGGLGGYFGRRW